MNRKHEQSIIDIFSKHFLDKGKSLGKVTNRFSLDGQDVLLGADYIFTEDTNFALVEFKYEEEDLITEGIKPLRYKLCQKLDFDETRKIHSLQCHYIAWSKKETEYRKVIFNKYHPEICNREIFKKSDLKNIFADQSSRVYADNLIDQFIVGSIGLTFEKFNEYINWLLGLGGKKGTSVEVMLDNPASNALEILEFERLDLLNNWLIKNRPKPAPAPNPRPPSP